MTNLRDKPHIATVSSIRALFCARLPEPGIALAALADALDLGDDLANLRFEGEDDEWRMELGRFRVAGKPAAFAVVASW